MECTTSTMACNVNLQLWLIMTFQCRFISFNKCITLVGDVDNGRDYACLGSGDYRKSLHLLINITVDLKLLFKKVYKNIHIAKNASISKM